MQTTKSFNTKMLCNILDRSAMSDSLLEVWCIRCFRFDGLIVGSIQVCRGVARASGEGERRRLGGEGRVDVFSRCLEGQALG